MHDFLFIKTCVLFIKTCGEYLKLPFGDILYVEALNKYVRIITRRKCYLISVTMNHIEKMLPADIFRRIHRSYIVSLNHANKFDNNLVYLENEKLPIGKRYRESILVDIIVLCAEVKTRNKLSNEEIDKLLRDIK
jgi:DNA-binding LytR/AlgR family response regulator